LAQGTEVDLGVPALLPQDYVPDVHHRLILYKRIAAAKTQAQLKELKIELIDRFGLLPPQTSNLFLVMEIKQRCSELGIERLEMNAHGGRILFSSEPNIDSMKLIELIQKNASTYRFDGQKTLRVTMDFEDGVDTKAFLDTLLDKLSVKKEAIIP